MSNDKNVLREGFKIVFADGVEREIFPLTIRQLRKFLKAIKGLDLKPDDELEDEDIDKMVEAAKIALEKDHKAVTEDEDGLEDVLDLKCFNDLLSAAMGTNPNV